MRAEARRQRSCDDSQDAAQDPVLAAEIGANGVCSAAVRMRSTHLLRSSLLAFVLLAALPLASAAAQVPRAVVLRFEGPQSDRARDAVLQEIASYVELVDEDRAVTAAQELGVDVSTPEGMAQVVDHLGISLVITGSVEGRGRRAQTEIIIVDARGIELARATGPSPRRRQDRAAIGQAAVQAVTDASVELEHQRQAAAAAAREVAARPVIDETEPAHEEPTAGWRQPMLIALGGLRLRTIDSGVDDPAGNRFYFAADMYPEINLDVVVRPFSSSSDDLRGLLFGVQGSFSVGVNYVHSNGIDQDAMTSMRFRLDAGYGYVIGDIFELIGTVGFGLEGVLIDNPEGYPSVLYSYLRPALGGRIRAYEDLVIVELGLGGRIGLDGGDLGPAFGPGLFFGGLDLFAGVMGSLDMGFTWAARFGYIYHSLSFDGMGGTIGNGDGGSDQAVEVQLLLGYTLR